MTTVTVELPKALTAEIEVAVRAGWFANEAEAIRAAVHEFVSQRKLALIEQQQLADIEWALDRRQAPMIPATESAKLGSILHGKNIQDKLVGLNQGSVHCATNSVRALPQEDPWWQILATSGD